MFRDLEAQYSEPGLGNPAIEFARSTPETADTRLLVDVDLSILGQPEAVFDQYERAVRQEYAWVHDGDFIRGRRCILEAFAARPSIYSTPWFRAKYERAARVNLARSMGRLSSRLR